MPGAMRTVRPLISASDAAVMTREPRSASSGKLRMPPIEPCTVPCAAAGAPVRAAAAHSAASHKVARRGRKGRGEGWQRFMVYIQGLKPRFYGRRKTKGLPGGAHGAASHKVARRGRKGRGEGWQRFMVYIQGLKPRFYGRRKTKGLPGREAFVCRCASV